MIREKSCGAVIFRQNDTERTYLVLHSALGHYSLCKGHVEGAETERQTAVREIGEETGLAVSFVDGFRQVITYSPRPGVMKDVVFFLARAEDGPIVCQIEEVADAAFLPYQRAAARLTHPSDRGVLAAAHAFLESR